MSSVCVLVGTDHHPFVRLVAWADEWSVQHPADRVVVQHGHSPAPEVAAAVAFLDPVELTQLVRSSDVVVTHGGPGTMMTARSGGRMPILVPRDPARGEHVDGHQVRFSRWVEDKGLATVVRDVTALGDAVRANIEHPVTVTSTGDHAGAPQRLAQLLQQVGCGEHELLRRRRRERRGRWTDRSSVW